jgi:AcrR family transcriptional regulator
MDKQPARWKRRKAARPAEILDAALDCFAERGFTATRMDDVAVRAGVTKGTVYLYFKTKEELFTALVRSKLLPNIERLEAASADAPAPVLLERLMAMWAEHLVPSRASVLPKLIMAEAGNFPELAKFYLDEVIHPARAQLASVLRRGVQTGEFRPIDVDSIVYCVLGPLLFAVYWRHSFEPLDEAPLDVAALCRTHLDTLLNGLRPPNVSGRGQGKSKGGEA